VRNLGQAPGIEFSGEEEPDDNPVDDTPEMSFIRRVRREMKTLANVGEFPYSLIDMLYKLGRVRGELDGRLRGILTDQELELRVRSELLVLCVNVVTTGKGREA
jgi:hypothetical protein